MKQALILLISIAVVFVAPGAQGSAHLSFSNITANVTRTGCGTSLLCVETPDDCDPAGNDSCLFTSINGTAGMAPDGTMLSVQLSGKTSGDSYIALGLTANASEGTSMVFICGRNNTSTTAEFFFRTMLRNNTSEMLSSTEINVTDIQSSITNTTIQCAFNIPGVNASRSRAADTTFVILLGSGSVDGNTIGNLNVSVTTDALNVLDPASNLNNNNNNTNNNNNNTNNNTTTTTSSALVTRMGCGTTKLCVETPEDCDPATNNTCLFTSINGTAGMAPNGTTLHFELSGTTSGDTYIGVALTANASEGTSMLYVCGRNGTTNGTDGTFFFLTVQRNNTDGTLTVMNGMAAGIQNLTTDARIQCVFYVPGVNASRSRAADTTFVVLLGSGSVNGNTLGSFTPNVTTAALNVLDPASNLNNNNNNTNNNNTNNNNTTTTSSLNITRTGCGTTKLCVETPEDCDPATNSTCLFTSVTASTPVASNGTMLSFELSGTSSGDSYIGVALTANASEGTAILYACGRSGTTNGVNGTFFFLTVQRNNIDGTLTVINGTATGIQNLTTDARIQCVFDIPGVGAASRSRNTAPTVVLQLGSGTVNGSAIGSFTPNVTTPPLNLADPASNVNNTTPTTPASALVTRMGCGTTKLCVETPEDCDPATNNTCLFTSINGTAGVAPNGATLNFELSGTSSGDRYIGVALTANASEGTGMLYVCGRNGTTNGTNGTFFFLTVQRNNTDGTLTVMNGMATGIQNLTTDARIQCVFTVPGVNASRSRAADTTFIVQVGSGNVNGSTLGSFTPSVTTAALNVLDPASNLNNTATTASPATTMSGANRAVFPQALPLLLSIFILSILKTA